MKIENNTVLITGANRESAGRLSRRRSDVARSACTAAMRVAGLASR